MSIHALIERSSLPYIWHQKEEYAMVLHHGLQASFFFFFFFEEFIESVNCSYFVPLKLHNMIDMNIAILNS